jgi:transposase
MSPALPLLDLAALPDEVRAAVAAHVEALSIQERQLVAEQAARAHLEAQMQDLAARNARLEHLVRELQRARFGKSSEKLDPDQLALSFEDIEIAIGEAREVHERTAPERRRRAKEQAGNSDGRRALPRELPRVVTVIEPDSLACPCGCGDMVKIGEDVSERLDIVPAQLRVLVTIRPRYACRKGRAGVAQAKAPPRLIEGGLPTEALIAHIMVAKYAEHMPLYRQWQVFKRHGVTLDRSILADWVGRASFHLRPIVERMAALIKQSGKLFMDETTAPVLDPGRGRTRTGYLWALARDDRPWGGGDPPGVVFHYAPGRGGAHAEAILEGFNGVLQVDGYAGYQRLGRPERAGGAPVVLAHCWAHARREIIKATPTKGSPVAEEILKRIASLYAIEKEIRGQGPQQRQAVRQARSRPIVGALHLWIGEQRARLSRKSPMGTALAYIANHWDGLCVFLDDGRVEMDSNPVENLIRPLALNRKNALFCGHDEGGANWARIASLIETCKLNDINPYAYPRATLEALAAGHPQARLDELLPWSFMSASA